jgi:hypothetical protein
MLPFETNGAVGKVPLKRERRGCFKRPAEADLVANRALNAGNVKQIVWCLSWLSLQQAGLIYTDRIETAKQIDRPTRLFHRYMLFIGFDLSLAERP